MYDLLFDGFGPIFGIPAVLGTVFFVLRLVLMLIGQGDAHGDVPHDVHTDPGEAFKVFSLQAFAAFFMGFGWAGIAAMRGAGLGIPPSLVIGAGGGAGLVWLLAALLRAVWSMQSSGNIDIGEAIGLSGQTYVNIPRSRTGRGQVRVVIEDRQRLFNAVTDGPTIPTGTPVQVVGTNPDNTITVLPEDTQGRAVPPTNAPAAAHDGPLGFVGPGESGSPQP